MGADEFFAVVIRRQTEAGVLCYQIGLFPMISREEEIQIVPVTPVFWDAHQGLREIRVLRRRRIIENDDFLRLFNYFRGNGGVVYVAAASPTAMGFNLVEVPLVLGPVCPMLLVVGQVTSLNPSEINAKVNNLCTRGGYSSSVRRRLLRAIEAYLDDLVIFVDFRVAFSEEVVRSLFGSPSLN